MKHRNDFFLDVGQKWALILFLWLLPGASAMVGASIPVAAEQSIKSDSAKFLTCKGFVTDAESGLPLAYASVLVEGSNMATVTNSEGEFSLKIPDSYRDGRLMVTFLGYQNELYPIAGFADGQNRVMLKISAVPLPEVSVVFKDAESLMQAVLDKRGENYVDDPTLMTAFYRETIRKRKSYVALLESVVDVYKMPYMSVRKDVAALYKARKNTDYSRLDTVVFKLMGGPYNTLYSDVMKDPENVFTEKIFDHYTFSFDRSTMVDDRLVYVLNFKQRSYVTDPLFYGKLYIDAQTLALVSAVYDLNMDYPDEVSDLYIRKKPLYAKVTVTKARYRINYLTRDNSWYIGYCRVELDVVVNWKRRLFNTKYESVMEMAVTDWTTEVEKNRLRAGERLKPSVVVSEAAAGFFDPDFWGLSNVIEPDKSIESAITKIQKRLKERK